MDNSTIDLFDRFSATTSAEERWTVANDVIRELGGCALNVGAARLDTLDVLWLQSSMSQMWLTEYVGRAYSEVDPLVLGLRKPDYPGRLLAGSLEREGAQSQKELDYNWGMRDAGYSFCHAHAFAGAGKGSRKVVTFCANEDVSVFRDEDFRRINQAAMAIAAFVDEPEGDDDVYKKLGRGEFSLSERERQMLRYLATGHQNLSIAHELGIAEVTVRKTFLSARKKLGARTREEALAVAVRAGLLDF
jgi:DNA-binding CsgD family transcriptional regulator